VLQILTIARIEILFLRKIKKNPPGLGPEELPTCMAAFSGMLRISGILILPGTRQKKVT